MNARTNNSPLHRLSIIVSLCALAAVFFFTDTGRDLTRQGMKLISPTVAESAIMPADDSISSFRTALEAEIYLPQEVDLSAGSDFIPENAEAKSAPASDLSAMLDGAGRQCNFRDHLSGSLAFNGHPDCI